MPRWRRSKNFTTHGSARAACHAPFRGPNATYDVHGLRAQVVELSAHNVVMDSLLDTQSRANSLKWFTAVYAFLAEYGARVSCGKAGRVVLQRVVAYAALACLEGFAGLGGSSRALRRCPREADALGRSSASSMRSHRYFSSERVSICACYAPTFRSPCLQMARRPWHAPRERVAVPTFRGRVGVRGRGSMMFSEALVGSSLWRVGVVIASGGWA